MRRLVAAAPLAAALLACHGEPPLKVAGPTTAKPPGATTVAQEQGVKSVAQRDPSSRVVAFRILFNGGSADDPPGKEGLTALTAAMTAESGTTKLTYAELAKALYPFAASIDAHVDRDQTVFEVQVAASSLKDFYPLLRDVILTPRLDEASFQRLETRAHSELVDDLRGADDEELGKEALQAFLYEGHPYGHPAVGTEAGLAALTRADVDAQRKHVFCKDRVVLGIAGNYPEGFDKTVAKDLAALPACDAPRASLPAPRKIARTQVLIVDKPGADATAISLGYPTDMTRASDDYPAVFFFTSYVGLHRQSAGVLYNRLREERGLNYGDYAYSEYFEQEGWERITQPDIARRQQMISIWIRPVKPANGPFALRGALHYWQKTVASGIPDEEVARFRTFLSRYEGLEQQTASRRLGYALDDLSYGLATPYLERMRTAWSGLTAAKLKEAIARRIAGHPFAIAIVTKDGAALKKTLVEGGPTPPTYDSPKPKEILEEDKTIEALPLHLKDTDVTVIPVDKMFAR